MHTYTQELTFKPLKGNRYRCNQTGVVMTKGQILAYVYNYLNTGQTIKINQTPAKPRSKSEPKKHDSKYQRKQRR